VERDGIDIVNDVAALKAKSASRLGFSDCREDVSIPGASTCDYPKRIECPGSSQRLQVLSTMVGTWRRGS
jgi:hypothetical protein